MSLLDLWVLRWVVLGAVLVAVRLRKVMFRFGDVT